MCVSSKLCVCECVYMCMVCVRCIWYAVKGHVYDCVMCVYMCDLCVQCIYGLVDVCIYLWCVCVVHVYVICVYVQYNSARCGLCAVVCVVCACLCLVCVMWYV